MKQYNMLTDHPGKSLLFFALPMILGNLFQQFYSTVDSIIVGQFVGEDALAAVGASYSLTTVFIMIAIGGGIGASVITSQYLGAGQYRKMKTSVYTALLSFLAVGILLSLVGLFLNEKILIALNTPNNILEDAMLYLEIYFIGLPFLFMYNILSSLFNALGNSKTPLYLLIVSSVFNIILDLLFVKSFGMGVVGAAAATVLAQGISAIASFCILMHTLRKYADKVTHQFEAVQFPKKMQLQAQSQTQPHEQEYISKRFSIRSIYDIQIWGSMLKVAIPSMLQQSIVSIGMLLVQSVVNGFGSSVLAGYSAGTRIESICIVPMIATGNAVSTFTAQNLGAGKPERVKQGYRAAVRIVMAFAVGICLILSFFHESIISSFLEQGSEPAAFATGNAYLSFLAFFFGFIGLKASTDGVLRGSGDVLVFTLANLFNLSIRVTVAFALAPVWGVQAVWIAVPMGWAANYVVSLIRYLSGKWSRKQLIKIED